MKSKHYVSLTTALTFLLSACGFMGVPGSGKIVSESREVSGFRHVDFSVAGELTLVQDGQESLELEADDNLMEYILTEVQGDTLHIYVQPGVPGLLPTRPIQVRLHVKDVEAVTVNGSGSAESENLEAERLDLVVNGSGKIRIVTTATSGATSATVKGSGSLRVDNIEAKSLVLTVNGSGEIEIGEAGVVRLETAVNGSGQIVAEAKGESVETSINGSGLVSLKGKTASQTVNIVGSGSYKAYDLESESATVSIGGSGNIRLAVSETLDATINGSGTVFYRGRPKIHEVINGSGTIRASE